MFLMCVQEKCIPEKHVSLYDIASDPWTQGIVAKDCTTRLDMIQAGEVYSMEWNGSSIKCGMKVFNTEQKYLTVI